MIIVHEKLKRFRCDQCEKAYSKKYLLNRHISAAHEGQTFSCHICGEGFTQSKRLETHKLIHADIEKDKNSDHNRSKEKKESIDFLPRKIRLQSILHFSPEKCNSFCLVNIARSNLLLAYLKKKNTGINTL